MRSSGWVDLESVNGVVGPELSFARKVTRNIQQPIAIIKCAAGGTTLGTAGSFVQLKSIIEDKTNMGEKSLDLTFEQVRAPLLLSDVWCL